MPTIHIRTEIPGPRSRALMARREAAVPRGPYNSTPVFMASAEGATLEDVDGNRYLDFAGGIGCLNVGHRAARDVGIARSARETLASVLRGDSVRKLRRAGGKIKRAGTRKGSQENHHREYRRGSCGERGQNPAGLYQAPRGDFLLGSLSWHHLAHPHTPPQTHSPPCGLLP